MSPFPEITVMDSQLHALLQGIQSDNDYGYHLNGDIEYNTSASKSHFDNEYNTGVSSFLTVPSLHSSFDSPYSDLSSTLSSFPSSPRTIPDQDDTEPHVFKDGSISESEYDSGVESLSLPEGKGSVVAKDAAYRSTFNYKNHPVNDTPFEPPANSPKCQALLRSQLRRTARKGIIAPTFDSDEENEYADVESDGGDASDDEYLPSSPLNPLKRRRSESPAPESCSADSPAHKRPRVTHDVLKQKRKKSSVPEDWTTGDDEEWKCPHPPCQHRQYNKRLPDFKRHQKTHTGGPRPICCGVPYELAGSFVIDFKDEVRSTPKEFHGVKWIGGCWKPFSRKDALLRHLNKSAEGRLCASEAVERD